MKNWVLLCISNAITKRKGTLTSILKLLFSKMACSKFLCGLHAIDEVGLSNIQFLCNISE